MQLRGLTIGLPHQLAFYPVTLSCQSGVQCLRGQIPYQCVRVRSGNGPLRSVQRRSPRLLAYPDFIRYRTLGVMMGQVGLRPGQIRLV